MTNKFFPRYISVFVVLAIVFTGVAPVQAAAGSLDLTFGTKGITTTDLNDHDDFGYGPAIQPDGKILIAGFTGISPNREFALTRYNSNGSLDPKFDTDGIVTTDFSNHDDFGYAPLLQPDRRIIVAGESNGDFALARYNSDGSLDTAFDADGKVTTTFSIGSDIVSAIALQPDGRIIAAGYGGDFGDFALARYNSDGSLDVTFDSDGKVLTDFGPGDEWVHDIALLADGKIIAAGYSHSFNDNNSDFALARYNSDGSLDATFGANGIVRTDFGGMDYGNALALQPDGKILVAGSI
jgi:serralysin